MDAEKMDTSKEAAEVKQRQEDLRNVMENDKNVDIVVFIEENNEKISNRVFDDISK